MMPYKLLFIYQRNVSVLIQGHTDELWGLAAHPTKPQFFTCGQDKHIMLWDSISHRPIWNKTIEVFFFKKRS